MHIQVRETELTAALLLIDKHRRDPSVVSWGTQKQKEPISNLLGPIEYVPGKSRNIPIYKPNEGFQKLFVCVRREWKIKPRYTAFIVKHRG